MKWIKASERKPPIVKNSLNFTIVRDILHPQYKKVLTYSKSPICELNRNAWKWEWLDETENDAEAEIERLKTLLKKQVIMIKSECDPDFKETAWDRFCENNKL